MAIRVGIRTVLAVFGALVLCLAPADALMIEMKDGRFYEGEIIGELPDVYVVRIKGRERRLKKAKIADIHWPAAEDGQFEYAPEKDSQAPPAPRKPVPSDASRFTKSILGSKLPVLVVFCQRTCPICPRQSAEIKQLALSYRGKVRVEWVDLDIQPVDGEEYEIRRTPTVIAVRRGEIIDRWEGYARPRRVRVTLDALAS